MGEQTQNQLKNGQGVEDNTLANLEIERLRSEINRNKSEAKKFALESKWFRKYVLAGLVAAGLLSAWFVAYFQPILNKKQEVAKLEIESLSLKNEIKQSELNKQAYLLSEENKKIKNDYDELIRQNQILEKEQQNARVKSEKLRQELKKTKDLYSELSKKYSLSLKERKNFSELVKKSEKRINSLNKEIEKLETAQKQTANRTEKLSEKRTTFGLLTEDGKRLIIEDGKP